MNDRPICGACGQMMPDDEATKLAVGISAHQGSGFWDRFEDRAREGYAFEVMTPLRKQGIVVACHVAYGEEPGEGERAVFIIFEVDGYLLRKDGVANSYGTISWGNSPVRPVRVGTRVLKTFEPVVGF